MTSEPTPVGTGRRRPLPYMMQFRSRLLFALGMVAGWAGSVICRADQGDLWLDVNGLSWHTQRTYFWQGQTRTYNQTNFGLGVGAGLNDWSEVKAGWFNNSYRKTSVYATVNLTPTWLKYRNGDWYVAPGVALGAITGYHDTPEQTDTVAPFGLLNVTVGHVKGWRFTLGYLPSTLLVKNGVNVVTLQFSFRIKP